MSFLMHYLKSMVHQFQETFEINKLSESENLGTFENSSFIRFFRGSLIEVPISLGRTIRGSSFQSIDLDPFIDILVDQDLTKFDVSKFSDSLLKQYLDEQLKKVDDFLDIGNPQIKKLPSWAIAYPWEDLGFYDLKNNYMDLLKDNRADHIENSNGLASDSERNFLTYAKSHGEQFKKLALKISTAGFDKSLPRPRIYVLKNGESWRWVMGGNGNHRAYITAALGHKTLPVQIIKIVDRSKIYNWPNVINNEYSKKEARDIFDIVFKGDSCIRGCY